MATVQTVITRALRLLQVVGSGVTPDSSALADGLTSLNAMLDDWRNQPLAAWTTDEITGNLTGGKQSYTLGPAGDIATTRPVTIKNARMLLNGVNYPLQLITQDEWAAIRVQTLQSNIPRYLYSTGDFPLITLNLWPMPSQSAQIILGLLHPFAAFAALTDAFSFPPGYEDAITYNLAIRLAPEFGVSVSGEVAKVAGNTLANLKRMNSEPVASSLGMVSGRRYNIYADF